MPTRVPPVPERRAEYRAYLLMGVSLVAAAYFFRSDLQRALYGLESTVGILGPLAPLAMSLLGGIWAALCLPGPIMLGVTGTIFASDPLLALAVVLTADTIATIIGFQVARHFGRRRVMAWLEHKPWFGWLEENTQRRGYYGVFFVRMMPFFPNSFANYALGLTSLKFWPYLLASVLGSIPNLALYVFGTAGTVQLLREGFVHRVSPGVALLFLVAVALALRALQAMLRGKYSEQAESASVPPRGRRRERVDGDALGGLDSSVCGVATIEKGLAVGGERANID